MSLKGALKARMDGFKNLLTGYGTSRDHGEQFTYSRDTLINSQTLKDMYSDHELCWKLIDLLPDDALAAGIEINEDYEDELEEKLKAIKDPNGMPCGLETAMDECLKMARVDGGAAIYLMIDDGLDPWMPLAKDVPHDILEAVCIEKDYLQPVGAVKRTGRNELWQMTGSEGETLYIHRDRLLFDYGAKVSRDRMIEFNGYGQSIIRRCWRPLMAYSVAHGMVPNILKSYIRDVLKLQGLTELSMNDCSDDRGNVGERQFWDRMDYQFQAESLLKMTVIDAEDELQRHTTSVAGINDLIRNPEKWICAASGMPHTKLFGEQSGGVLTQAGSSQSEDWAKAVGAYQKQHVRPLYQKVFYILTGSYDIEFTFCPIDKPKQKEQSEVFVNVANAVSKLVQSQIISPDEAATMFEGEQLRMTPKLDDEARQMLAEQSINPEDMNNGREETSQANYSETNKAKASI